MNQLIGRNKLISKITVSQFVFVNQGGVYVKSLQEEYMDD